MLGSLITLPFRIGIRSAEAILHTSQAVVEGAIGRLGEVIAPTARTPTRRPEEQRRDEPAPRSQSAGEGAEPEDRGPVDPRSHAEAAAETIREEDREPVPRAPEETTPAAPSPTAPEPDHVSEEAVVVEAVSEPGAEDGAGAQIHIAEPWNGYRELKAADVVDRIRGMSAAELAAVELYELSHRKRQTVIDAVAGELRRTQHPGQ